MNELAFNAYGRTINVLRLKAGEGSRVHHHPDVSHMLYVVEGRLHVWLDGIKHTAAPEETAVFPVGVEHCWTAVTDALIVLVFEKEETPDNPFITEGVRT